MAYLIYGIDKRWFHLRLKLLFSIVSFGFILLLSRLFFLQIMNGEELRSISKKNSTKFSRIYPTRGLIFDRNGKLLVENRPSFDLYIDTSTLDSVKPSIAKISLITSLNFEELLHNFDKKVSSPESKKQILLKSGIDRESLVRIRVNRYSLPEIETKKTSKRNYIYESSLSHVLGYVGKIGIEELHTKSMNYKVDDVIGKCGIERSMEYELRGKCGGVWDQINASGKTIKRLDIKECVPGNDITLNIDHKLQVFSESIFKGNMGAIVALEPFTGEVLSMVSSPSYNQNIFVNKITKTQWKLMVSDPMKPFINKAIQGQYPPASIYKIITAVAGIEENVVDETTEILCEGFHELGNKKYFCWKTNGHGKMDIVSALAESCDVFFYTLGYELGIDCLAKYANLFGLGSCSGIDLENESKKGLVPTPSWKKKIKGTDWQPRETLPISIGQISNLVTPLQMAVVAATIANGGYRYRPLILKNIKESSNTLKFENKSNLLSTLPLKKKTIKIIQEGLERAIKNNHGTADAICNEQTETSGKGKTGTAQIVSRKYINFSKDFKDHAWFIGYAPSDNPKIALAIILEHGENGSKMAAPIGAAILEYYLDNK